MSRANFSSTPGALQAAEYAASRMSSNFMSGHPAAFLSLSHVFHCPLLLNRVPCLLVKTYGLKKETFSPGALLEAEKTKLTGQVLYDPAEPWTRNIALTAAAVQPGAVVATDSDLGLKTVLDTRKRWKDRVSAYTWAIDQYVGKANMHSFVLAPESGHLLSYGPERHAVWRRLAYFVDRILKGAAPADLPIELPTTMELVVNRRTAAE